MRKEILQLIITEIQRKIRNYYETTLCQQTEQARKNGQILRNVTKTIRKKQKI